MSDKPLTMHPFESAIVRTLEADNARLAAENEKLAEALETAGRLFAASRDENARLTAELRTASDMNGVYECRLQEKEAENEKLRAALNSIAANTYGYEPDVLSDEEAKNYFAGLFFDAQNKARAALSGDKQWVTLSGARSNARCMKPKIAFTHWRRLS